MTTTIYVSNRGKIANDMSTYGWNMSLYMRTTEAANKINFQHIFFFHLPLEIFKLFFFYFSFFYPLIHSLVDYLINIRTRPHTLFIYQTI